jgi:hypothetical protein
MDDQTETDPQQTAQLRAARLRQDLEAVADEAESRAKKARNYGRFWRLTYILLGLPAAVLAAAAGTTALASTAGRIPAAYLALAAAAFAAAATFLGSDARESQNNRLKTAWRMLEADARLALIQEGYVEADETYATLAKLHDRRKSIFTDQVGIIEYPRSDG